MEEKERKLKVSFKMALIVAIEIIIVISIIIFAVYKVYKKQNQKDNAVENNISTSQSTEVLNTNITVENLEQNVITENTVASNNTTNENEEIKFNSYKIDYYLDNDDKGFLDTTYDEPTKYHLFDSYANYEQTINTIDKWIDDMVEYHINEIVNYRYENLDISKQSSEERKRIEEEIRSEAIYNEEYRKTLEERAATIEEGFNKGNYTEDFFKTNNLLLVENSVVGQVLHEIKLNDVCIDNNNMTVYISEEVAGVVGGGDSTLFFITLSKDNMNNVENININLNSENTSEPGVAYKPIIYLYPQKEEKVTVKLGAPDKITCSYPKYQAGWNMIAKSNGDLKDMTTGKNLYALYYESNNVVDFKVEKDGFVVKGEDLAGFLEEKLEKLGLTEREAEEFIVYWLPKLESNKYNYIRFATSEEIEKNMSLNITPKSDTTIRVLMTFKGLEKPINVKEQKIVTPERKGFVAVEWGGTEIK